MAIKKKIAVDPNLERWKKKGRSLADAKNLNQWAIGDWILTGVSSFGKKQAYDTAQKATGMERATLYLFKDTAECFPISTRVKNLRFGHHRLVANNDYTPEKRRELLRLAKGLSVASFAARLRKRKKDAARRSSNQTSADRAADKVADALDALLRVDSFVKILNNPPTPTKRAELLNRLKQAAAKLNNKIEQMTRIWNTADASSGASEQQTASDGHKAIGVGAGK